MIGNRKKTVLIVAGEFPPLKTIGRIRSAKFVEHLRNHDWRPIVLTIEAFRPGLNFDVALEKEIPVDVLVYRSEKPDLEANLVLALKRLFNRSKPDPAQKSPPLPNNEERRSTPNHPRKNRYSNFLSPAVVLFKSLLRNFVYIPDDFNLWAKRSTKLAQKICEKHHVDLVYTSLPPFSSCHIGYALRKKLGIPWVVDYRDLWYGDVLREWIGPLRKRLELFMEKYYLRHADAVISVSEQKTAYLKKLHTESKARWETLTNGYDTEIYRPLLAEPRATDNIVDFVYTGRLFKNRRGYAFAEALGQLVKERPEIKNRVKVHILGGVSPEIQNRYHEILEEYDITELYNFTGDIDYHEAIGAQVHADYLLLIVDTGETSDGVIPGKLFEYIAAKRPIFALTNPGATQTIIENARIGTVVPAESSEHCKKELLKVFGESIPEELQANEAYLEQFDRKLLTKKLSTLFDEISSKSISVD